ncbi:LOW QUALITY PROTEIN: hypothetical protein CVT26_012933 [Gymnopilus dilepis]|uniref:Glycolipid transfer protein domain-containing protein n=1 Tax=Gymnopilus dilepis TaxID=231916 RepID=A0A409Y485_9AGAR|nr:LOW QUALITY PROTEIN: hypothetical protein CVT26_012933 [Gymnopilus dilepis]
MTPYFETVKSFADVPLTSEGVETASFLEASDGLVQMFGEDLLDGFDETEDLRGFDAGPFDLLGSGVFGFVQTDIRNNINGVRVRYEIAKDKSGTLENLVRSESTEREGERNATPCLVRLLRGLSFTCKALQNMQRDRSTELHVCFKRSYDEVLRHHHTFIIRSVVAVAIRAVPRRDDFYAKISQGGSIPKLDLEMAKWLEALERIVTHMSAFLAQGGYGRV